jgi:hypothetical protein
MRKTQPTPRPIDYRTIEAPLAKLDSLLEQSGKQGWHLVGVSSTDKTSQAIDATRGDRLYLLIFKR